MTNAVAGRPPLRIRFGDAGAREFETGVPVLAGETVEDLFGAVPVAGREGLFTLFRTESWLLGAATVPLGMGLEDATRLLYRALLEATDGWNLARVWNYVPAINENGPGGLENYRLFCRGRSLAFEEAFGGGFKKRLPSGSAVGAKTGDLTVAFAACPDEPLHFENPLQMPAYEYPSATVVVSNSWDGIKDFGYERRADFSAGMDRLSADLDDRTREFRAKHAGATDAMAKDRDAAAKEYDEARADLKTRMTDLGNATAATWSDSKAKAADSYKRVQAAYDKANATPHS